MLSAMRTGAKSMFIKTFLFGLLLLAMFGLAFFDVQGMFRQGVRSSTLVKIGREKITTTEFSQTVQNILRGQRIPEEQAYAMGLPRQILDQEVSRRLLQRAASDIGIIVGDKAAAPKVKEILGPLVTERKIGEKEALETLLSSYNMSEARFVSMIKTQMATETLVEALTSGARAPQQLLEDALKFRHELRQGEYFTLTSGDAGDLAAPSEEELKEHYGKISARFALPEYRSFSVLVLDKKALGLEGAIADDVLKQHYEDNIADYAAPEMRRVSQIVAKDQAEAQKIYEEAKVSKDIKKAESKGKNSYVVGTYAQVDLPEDLAKAAFAAAEGSVVSPVQSPLGWHILHVEKVVPPATQSFAAVKAKIAKEMSEDKSADALYERANKIDDMLAGGSSIAEVAREYKLAPVPFINLDNKGVDRDGKKPASTVAVFDKVLKEVFSLDKGEASQLIETPGGGYVIAEVAEIVPSAEEPFAQVRAQVAKDLKDARIGRALDEKAGKLLERLKLGDAFEKVAADAGKRTDRTAFLERGATADNLPRGLLPSLFSLDKIDAATSVAGDAGSVHILKLSARKADAPKEQKKEDIENLTAQLNQSLQNDILDQYRQALIAEYDVKINDELLQQTFAPKGEAEE